MAEANKAKTDGPFATVARARNEVRKFKKLGQLPQGATVAIRGGTYYLAETLSFGLEDSGSVSAPTVYKAYGNERVVISGGRVVSGLVETKVAGLRAWQVRIPDVVGGQWNFRQLFHGTHRRAPLGAAMRNRGLERDRRAPQLEADVRRGSRVRLLATWQDDRKFRRSGGL